MEAWLGMAAPVTRRGALTLTYLRVRRTKTQDDKNQLPYPLTVILPPSVVSLFLFSLLSLS